jgi:hypothetical protein
MTCDVLVSGGTPAGDALGMRPGECIVIGRPVPPLVPHDGPPTFWGNARDPLFADARDPLWGDPFWPGPLRAPHMSLAGLSIPLRYARPYADCLAWQFTRSVVSCMWRLLWWVTWHALFWLLMFWQMWAPCVPVPVMTDSAAADRSTLRGSPGARAMRPNPPHAPPVAGPGLRRVVPVLP